jgi:DNA-directed RNA polymerase beta subunit
MDPEDMPFVMSSGVIPDILMSPLGLTSRMTVGKIIEAITGKAVVASGNWNIGVDEQRLDNSSDTLLNEVQEILKQHGFNPNGTEVFLDGKTGRRFAVPIMTGFLTYVKLNHMVKKKAHARSVGPIQPLTRQPTEGKKRHGGLRVGAMEIECMAAHAATAVLQEKTFTTSDPFKVHICTRCGIIAATNLALPYYYCYQCSSHEPTREIKLSYSTKTMVQELYCTGIDIRLGVPPL